MVQIQIISKILETHDISILDDNLLTADYFTELPEEIAFIIKHNEDYNQVPDKLTFLSKFPDFELVEVTESDEYLVNEIREEYLYYKSVPVVQKIAELLKDDANAAAEYMMHAIKDLEPNYAVSGIDIIAQAQQRYDEYLERKNHQDNWYLTTGFKELDEIIHGLQCGEEFVVLVARTNQGKSWILAKMCTHIWQLGYNVGYISPEMGATSIGYRFDTLLNHFSNSDLTWGKDGVNETEYENYIKELADSEHKFMVSTPADFQRSITVTKLKNYIKKYKLNMLAIDGITYLVDERYRKGDNKTTSLTNISEDLMSLSIEMGIPIVVVAQANRGAVPSNEEDDGAPELETIRDSDGIAFNASKVISMRQLKNHVLRLEVKKQRFGMVGAKLDYTWDINTGEFTYLEGGASENHSEYAEYAEEREEKPRRRKRKSENEHKEAF